MLINFSTKRVSFCKQCLRKQVFKLNWVNSACFQTKKIIQENPPNCIFVSIKGCSIHPQLIHLQGKGLARNPTRNHQRLLAAGLYTLVHSQEGVMLLKANPLHHSSSHCTLEAKVRQQSWAHATTLATILKCQLTWKLHLTTKMYHILSCHRSLRALSH